MFFIAHFGFQDLVVLHPQPDSAMSAAHPKSAAAPKRLVSTQVWWAYCPVGECSKGNATLGRAYSEKRARQRIYDHLVGAPAHRLSDEEATSLADGANAEAHTLITEMVDEEEWNPNQQPSKRQRKQLLPSDEGTYIPPPPQPSSTVSVPIDLGDQIRLQTRNAFVFVKAFLLANIIIISFGCFDQAGSN